MDGEVKDFASAQSGLRLPSKFFAAFHSTMAKCNHSVQLLAIS